MALINHWPLQTDLRDIVGGNDGSVGAGVLTFAPVSAGIQAPVFDETFFISHPAVVTDADGDYTIFLRFTKNSITAAGLVGVTSGNSPTLKLVGNTTMGYHLVGSGFDDQVVPALGAGENSVMLAHKIDDTVDIYTNGALRGNNLTQDGTLNFSAIGNRNGTMYDGLIWDVRVFDSDEGANAAAIHADTPIAEYQRQSLSNLIPFNDFGF